MFEKLGSYYGFTAWSHNSRYSSSALACFKSYMQDRQQYLRIGSEMSNIGKSEFHKDPFWNRPYLTCLSTICLAFQIIVPYNPS